MRRWFKSHFRALLLTVVALSALPSYLWSYKLSGASDAPTMLLRDIAVVNRAAYDLRLPYTEIAIAHTGTPRRGDLVLAHLPQVGTAFKRVLGLPGETIELRENCVIVDGRELPVRPVDADFSWVPARHRMGSSVVMEDGHWAAYTPGAGAFRNVAPVHLRTGEYFLLGDNRDNSVDSRSFGPVSRDLFVGKVVLVLPMGLRR